MNSHNTKDCWDHPDNTGKGKGKGKTQTGGQGTGRGTQGKPGDKKKTQLAKYRAQMRAITDAMEALEVSGDEQESDNPSTQHVTTASIQPWEVSDEESEEVPQPGSSKGPGTRQFDITESTLGKDFSRDM